MKNLYHLKNKDGRIMVQVVGECVDEAIEKIKETLSGFVAEGYGYNIFTGVEGYILKNTYTQEAYYLSVFCVWID